MNDLNSVILEGAVSTKLKAVSSEEGTFTVATHRYYKVGGSNEVEETFVHVYLRGMMLDFASNKDIEGRKVRIVGRLCQRDGNLSLFCEHLEFKGGVIKSGIYNFKRD